jgi:uncharacterized protein
MNTVLDFKPRKFFIIVYVVTLISWSLAAYFSYTNEAIFVPFLIPGMLAPFATALWMILTSKSRELKKKYRERLFNLKLVRPLTLIPIVLIMPVVLAISFGLSLLVGQSPSQLQIADEFSSLQSTLPVLMILILASTFEELGWRGYAFDALNAGRNLFSTTLIFALLWAAWHLPLFFVNGYYHNEIVQENLLFGLNFLVSVIPMAFILTWAWKANRGSIPVVIVFHFLVNLCQEALQITQVTKSIETGVLFAAAAVIILLNRKMFFDKSEGSIQ